MKVLQVSKFYHPDGGGLEQVVRTVAEGMVERGHESEVLAADRRGTGGTERIDGVSVRRTACAGTLNSVPVAPAFPVRLRQHARRADIVHYHLPNPLCVGGGLVAPPPDARTVVTYHSDIVRQSTALRFYRPALDAFLDRVDRVLVTSPNMLEFSDHLDPYRGKTSVVPLSVDVDEYGTYDGPDLDLPIPTDDPIVLFVGRHSYYKGIEYLIDAMAGVDAQLLVVGDGRRRRELEARADRESHADRISFLGRVSEGTLHYCYDLADVFVLPSVEPSEAFGVVQLEAMAHRTPIVNTDLPTGVPWVSQHGETGLTVPPRDAGALADAIETLLADPDRRRRYGRNGRRRVERRFDEERMLSAIEDVYRTVLSEDRSPSGRRSQLSRSRNA